MSRYVICYQGENDPPVHEERELVSYFRQVRVIDKMPGTILVDGPEFEIALAVARMKQWTFSRERDVGVEPPHKSLEPPE